MNLEFGKLEIVERTFTRANSAPRGQAYEGIKFRRYESEAGVKDGGEKSIKELFVISDKAFDLMNLSVLALGQANFGGNVYLLAMEDQDEVEPIAKFMRQSLKKDGTKLSKTKSFSNEFLQKPLEVSGVLDATTYENQFLSLVDVTAEVTGLPSHVVKVFRIEKDTTVDVEAEKANEAAEGVAEKAKVTASNDF
jgi:hypothetical protein